MPPTFNIPWVIATSLCVWFLFIHAPIAISSADFFKPRLFWIHMVGVSSIYLVCAHNTLLTPSTFGGRSKPFHVWAGRIGLLLGVVGFYSGFVLTWFAMDWRTNMGFSIGITCGGICQMHAQFVGYFAIKKYQAIKAQVLAATTSSNSSTTASTTTTMSQDELWKLQDEQDQQLEIHVTSMVTLFVLACGIPGLIRLIEKLGSVYLFPSLVGIYYLAFVMAKPILERIQAKRALERRGVNEITTNYTPLEAGSSNTSHYQTTAATKEVI